MIKGLIKLAIVAVLANAIWQFGSAYMSFYKFKDAVLAQAMNQEGRSEEELRERIAELATNFDIPIPAEEFSIRRSENHTLIEGAYTKQLTLLPRFKYPWAFTVSVDAYTVQRARINDLANPSDAK